MTCFGVFRRLMLVAHYVHGVRSWWALFILEELPSICAAREQGDRRVGVVVGAPVTSIVVPRARPRVCYLLVISVAGRACTYHPHLHSSLPTAFWFQLHPVLPNLIDLIPDHQHPTCDIPPPCPSSTCSLLETARPPLMWPPLRSL